MRADYLDKFAASYKKGLKALVENSRVYTRAYHDHVPTETSPGHAAIITGKPPGETGIIGNEWLDREKGRLVESVEDPVFLIGPAQLKTQTLGDQMKAHDPEAKVVALSYKDRAAVMVAGHKANLCLWFDKKTNGFTTSAAYGPPPQWLGPFNQARVKNRLSGPTTATDRRTLELAERVLAETGLGEDEHCDLLAISFSGTDLIGHAYGPDSPQMRAQLLSLDQILGDLLNDLAKKTGGNFVLALTSDHGVLPIPESPQGKELKAKRVLTGGLKIQLENACQRAFPAPQTKWLLALCMPNVYLNKTAVEAGKMDWGDFLIRVAAECKKIPDVAMVYMNNPLIFQDELSPIYQRSYFAGRSGDLSLRMKSGVLVTERLTGTSHGTPNDYDAHVPLLFYGADFPKEKVDARVSIEIIAPILAKAIGFQFD